MASGGECCLAHLAGHEVLFGGAYSRRRHILGSLLVTLLLLLLLLLLELLDTRHVVDVAQQIARLAIDQLEIVLV